MATAVWATTLLPAAQTSAILHKSGGLWGRSAVPVARRAFSVVLTQEWKRRRRFCVRAFKGAGATAAPPRTGVLDAMQHLTLYDLLDISAEVGIREIKTAYREKARQYHPDANPPSKKEECTKMFLQVQEAYEVLMDPDSRAHYDYSLQNPINMQALKSGMPFKRDRSRSRGSASEPADVDKGAWRVQWRSQLDGLKRDYCKKNPSPWATAMQDRRRRAAAAGQAN